MEDTNLIPYLMEFNLTGQEALVYLELLHIGTSTGYEIAKSAGISRSNVYKALEGLTDKGAAYLEEGASRKYTGVDAEEFCQNKIRSLEEHREYLCAHLPRRRQETEGYLTICSDENISDKVRNMLELAQERVYVSMSSGLLELFTEELQNLLERDIKVVILTEQGAGPKGAGIYLTQDKENQIGIITDSRYVLTGELGKGKESVCLYSGQPNFVQVFKESMKNEIRLLELERQKEHTS